MSGKLEDKIKYLESLDETEFVHLIADILSIHFNHTNVKIVDGPGDGKRDIFSLNKNFEKTITQCKFHYDSKKTSGTRETDEIVIALNKFDYSNGFFCTSGKISPQAKREYLDNYPNYNLQWLEGYEIVDIVLKHNLLKQLWLDNEKIHLVTSSISIPFIVRKLPEDIAIEPTFNLEFDLPNKIEIEIEKVLSNYEQFHPYRNLEIRKSGSHFGNVFGFKATLKGHVNYNSLEEVRKRLATYLFETKCKNQNDSYHAIRYGTPYFNDVNKPIRDYEKNKFNLPVTPNTYVLNHKSIIDEYEWLIELSDDWKRPDRISMSQLNDFCFYNKAKDFVLYVYYTCRANKQLNPHVERQYEIDKVIWSKSCFAFGDTERTKQILENDQLLMPDEIYQYGSSDKVLCWFHPRPFMYPSDIIEFEKQLVHEEFENEKRKIKTLLNEYRLSEIEWEKVTKIAALNSKDPFPVDRQITYRIVDIFEKFDEIPSPLKPNNREFIFECVWRLCEKESQSLENNLEIFSTDVDNYNSEYELTFTLDDQTQKDVFLRITFNPKIESHLSTREIVSKSKADATKLFNDIEKILQNIFKATKRFTNKYWFAELGVFLNYDTLNEK